MDSPKFRNYPCSSWLLVYGNTIEMPGNSSIQPTGLQKRMWRRGSTMNSCVVQLPVCAWHIQQWDWAATGDHSSKSPCLEPMETTVAESKLYAQSYSSGSSGRPQEPFFFPAWEETIPSHSSGVYSPCLVAFGPK